MKYKTTVFISDTHGFYHAWTTLLKDIGLLDNDLNWIGGPDVQLVHVGDHTDRGEDSVGLYRLLTRLKRELAEDQVILLIGNHDLQYLGGPPCGAERHIIDNLAVEMQQDLRDGIIQFAHDFEANDGSWLVVHAGMADHWRDLHAKPVAEVVDYINDAGRRYLNKRDPEWKNKHPGGRSEATDLEQYEADLKAHRAEYDVEFKRRRVIDGIGESRGGRVMDGPGGITWSDYWYDLRVNERDGQHRQIVGHTIQPNGIERSPSGRFWGVNVHYNHAQALVYDHETGEFNTTALYAPYDSPFLTHVKSQVVFHTEAPDDEEDFESLMQEEPSSSLPDPDDPIWSAFIV
jgi:hypothetical protein